jgi:hypothetical protein
VLLVYFIMTLFSFVGLLATLTLREWLSYTRHQWWTNHGEMVYQHTIQGWKWESELLTVPWNMHDSLPLSQGVM